MARETNLELIITFDVEDRQFYLYTLTDIAACEGIDGIDFANEGDEVPVTPERLEQIKAVVQDESKLEAYHPVGMLWAELDSSTRLYINDELTQAELGITPAA